MQASSHESGKVCESCCPVGGQADERSGVRLGQENRALLE